MIHSAKFKLPLIGLLVVLMTAGSLLALAADPEPAAPVSSGEADAATDAKAQTGRSTGAELDVNQAELLENGGLMPEAEANANQAQFKPMTVEINALLTEARVQVALLQDRFDKEPNAEVAMGLVRQIEQLKINSELDIMRVQSRYALAAGNDELVQEIEAALTQMTTPRPRKQPIDRPAPGAGNH